MVLCATTEGVSVDGLRAFYKGRSAAELVPILERAPSMRLGTTYVVEPDNAEHRGPVGRVVDLLALRGTRTWPPARLPLLDDELQRALLAAFEPRPKDPELDVAPVLILDAFLTQNRGAGLATCSTPVE